MGQLSIVAADFGDARVLELLATHVRFGRAGTAPGSAHALEAGSLRAPHIDTWTIWDGGTLLGIGALQRLSAVHGEIKSMHVAAAARRRGVGSAMLRHIVAAARARGLERLSLETGAWPQFEPARALYRRHGFTDCAPFGAYVADANSVFMSLAL